MKAFRWAVLLVAAALAWAQPNPLLPAREALQLCARGVQLMESTAAATPELARAAEPLIENARQARINLEAAGGRQNSGYLHTLLGNLQAWIMLADAVPKPVPLPEEARRQLAELRDVAARLDTHFRALLVSRERDLVSPDRDNLARYAEANVKLGAPVSGKPRVVFLGDSITDGWRLNEYFPDRDFVNRGIGGQITSQMLARMKADVIDRQPAAMLVLAGTNDLARGTSLATIENNLTMIADLAEAARIKVLLASILPISDYHKDKSPNFLQSPRRPPASIRELNSWIAAFCRTRRATYVNYYDAVVDSAGFLRADLADDGLHPNSDGYRLMAPVAVDAIDRTLPAPAPPKKRR